MERPWTRTDVAVVGAGPVGIELAVALKRHGIEYLHFDAGQVGQTMFWWPPATRWFSSNERISIAGVPLQTIDQSKATREEYLCYLRSIVLQFDLRISTFEPVVGIEPLEGGYLLTTRPRAGPRTCWARSVVLATGGTALPRKLGVPGEDLPHVSHYMADPHKYFRKRVMVVGGKNSAVEGALRIHQVGADVSLSYRRAALDASRIKYWLMPEIGSLLKRGRIHGYFNTLVRRITPSHVVLGRCAWDADGRMLGGDGQDEIAVPADFVLLLVGYLADMSLARLAGVELRGDNEIPVYNEQTMETNIPGIYIAGTAIGGTQDHYRIFLENCHIHTDRILAALTGAIPPAAPQLVATPET